MNSKYIILVLLMFSVNIYGQQKNLTKADTKGKAMVEENKDDFVYYGNWEVINSESDSADINLMPNQNGPTGKYLILKPTNQRSAVSSYRDDGYHSVEIGFYAYRKGNKFYGNLDASVAIMFEDEYKGQLIAFECKYIKSKDQLKLKTSKNVVFYLKRIE